MENQEQPQSAKKIKWHGTTSDDAHAQQTDLRVRLIICAWCKRIRGNSGSWHQSKVAIPEDNDIPCSHGICPACAAVFLL